MGAQFHGRNGSSGTWRRCLKFRIRDIIAIIMGIAKMQARPRGMIEFVRR